MQLKACRRASNFGRAGASLEPIALLSSPGTSMNSTHESRSLKKKLLVACTLVTLLSVSSPAYAELGGDEASIQTDQAQMQGVRRIARAATHVMHEIQTPTGTKVREYVSPGGKVFGVAWEGPSFPNMRQLLGPYFDQVSQAQTSRRGRGPLVIHLPGLVFYSGGHMRVLAGQAYIPDMVPQGVTAEAIR